MKRAAKIVAALAGVVVVFFAGLAIFNLAAAAIGRSKYPPLGNLYKIEGREMHLYCTGAGSPTIVLEAGAGDDVLYWQTIQPELAKITRVCSYDRAGIGWSEPQSGTRDAEAMARQLHELLNQAGVTRPLIMVGASAGAFYVREYTRQFPDEVAGMALVDGSSANQVNELPGSRVWFDGEKQKRPRELKWERLRVWSGWQRLMGRCHEESVPARLEPYHAAMDAEDCRPAWVGGDLPEFLNFEVSGREADRLTSLGERPLLVISQDPNRSKQGWTADAIAGQPVWNRLQENLKSLSARSWRVIARGAPHNVHLSRPELVVSEIGKLIGFVRGGAAPAWGTTVTE